MDIIYNNSTKEFHIFNNGISYILNIMKNNQLGQVYFGKRIKHRESFKELFQVDKRDYTACVFEDDDVFSLEHIKQEYPAYGTTDFRDPAYQIKQSNGSRITNFEFESYKIYEGKQKLDGLPATYVESEKESLTLEIILYDKIIEMKLILSYTVFENYSAITKNAKFINCGNDVNVITRAMSACIDLPDDEYEMLYLSGLWGREKHIEKRELKPGIQSVYSMKGASGANHNPFIALKRPDTTEHYGEVYGCNLVYSGNFLAQVEVDANSQSRMIIGINPCGFEWVLESGEEFQTPEAVIVYSDQGLNGMSQIYHELYRTRLCRGEWRDKVRPVLLNNWEATYFDFNEDKVVEIAREAKVVGIELFVLDDGWFGKRNDDTSSLGDWICNKNKIPSGIEGLSKKIEELGLKFGLWFEPEMVNKNSELYRQHPQWVISTPGRRNSPARNQYVLDFSRQDVVDYIYEQMAKILRDASISYVKWDMNRNITEAFSDNLTPERQGEFMHRYILGVYSLYEKLVSEFPSVLFESCAGGGGRFDAGMLYYAPQTWTSDNTDAIERLKIQSGTSMVYPISSMAAHVSAVPNHQVHRVTPIETRANVAYFGMLGYELDLGNLNNDEKLKVKEQIEFYKTNREFIMKGVFYRIVTPFEKDGNITVWMVVSKDKKEAIVGYYRILTKPNQISKRIKLKGLSEEFEYHISGVDRTSYGDELMNIGVLVENNSEIDSLSPNIMGDFYSQIFIIKAVN